MKFNDIYSRNEMLNLSNIHSVTDFQRNPKGILGKLKESKSPIVLTVNGKAALVVQDAESYQAMLDKVQAAEAFEAIRRGYAQSLAGEVTSFEEFDKEFRAKHGL